MKRISFGLLISIFALYMLTSCDDSGSGKSDSNSDNVLFINWLGELDSEPYACTSETVQDAYRNTSIGASYLCDGTAWQLIAQDGADGEDGATGATGATGSTGATGPAGYFNWLGESADIPVCDADHIQDAYRNTVEGATYFCDGSAWQLIARDGADGEDGLNGEDGIDGVDALGNITQNTTFLTGTTYVLERSIVVKEGITLTIEPGVTLALNPYVYIYVDGTLNAEGTLSQPIIVRNEGNAGADGKLYFTTTSTNNTIHYVEMQNTSLLIDGGDFDIQYCNFTNAPSVYNANPLYSIFIRGYTSSEVVIANCTMIGLGTTDDYSYGIRCDSKTSATITMTNCIISDFQFGIWVNNANSIFTLNTCSIIDNTVRGVVSYDGSVITIHNSNIYGNSFWNYFNIRNVNQDATSNWWGTTNTTTISSSIYDHGEDSAVGTVDFSSYLSSEVTVTGCGW